MAGEITKLLGYKQTARSYVLHGLNVLFNEGLVRKRLEWKAIMWSEIPSESPELKEKVKKE